MRFVALFHVFGKRHEHDLVDGHLIGHGPNSLDCNSDRVVVGQAGGQTGAIMASSLIAVVPMIIVYLVFQRYYLEGVASSGVKG